MSVRSESTRASIQEAFTRLLEVKTYEAITMAGVARRAQRSRSTVYRHYPDKEGLLLDCFGKAVEELKGDVVYPPGFPEQGASPIAYANLVRFYTHVANHRPLYHALLLSSAGPVVRSRFRRVVAGVMLHFTEQTGSLTILPAPPDMVCSLIAEMVVGAAVWWLEARADYEPALLAEIVVRLGEAGLFGLNGQEPVKSDLSYRPFVPRQ